MDRVTSLQRRLSTCHGTKCAQMALFGHTVFPQKSHGKLQCLQNALLYSGGSGNTGISAAPSTTAGLPLCLGAPHHNTYESMTQTTTRSMPMEASLLSPATSKSIRLRPAGWCLIEYSM